MKKEIKKKDILKRPEYPGGTKALKAFVASTLRYPQAAIDARVEGTVSLRYAIDHKGKVGEVKVIRSVGYGCDEEAIRIVRLLQFDVERTRGMRVLFHKNIQIHFRLTSAPAPAPAASLQVQYQYTPSQPAKAPEAPAKPKTITFTLP